MHAYRQKIREIPKSIMSKFWIIRDSSLMHPTCFSLHNYAPLEKFIIECAIYYEY